MEEKIFKYLIMFVAILLFILSGVYYSQIKDKDKVNLYMAVISYMLALWCLNLI